jgi:hypothetical protein
MPDWLLDEAGLAIVRRAYARQMLGAGNIRNDRLEQVFATIRRDVCAEGTLAGDTEAELALCEAFERGGFEFVRSLRWNEPMDPMRRWYGTPAWSLSYDAVADPG